MVNYPLILLNSFHSSHSSHSFQLPSQYSNSFTTVIFYTAWYGTCSIIDYIVLVGFFNRIFDIIKFGTKCSTSITFWLERFQVMCDACLFSKTLINAHLFSSIGKQKCIRFRINGEFIGYDGGSISITLDVLILYLFCYLFNDPFWEIAMFLKKISSMV